MRRDRRAPDPTADRADRPPRRPDDAGSFENPEELRPSDDRLRDAVSRALTWAADVDATGIEVVGRAGEITLLGTVPDRLQAGRAEHVAAEVEGVRAVRNRLRVPTGAEEDAAVGRGTSPSSKHTRAGERTG